MRALGPVAPPYCARRATTSERASGDGGGGVSPRLLVLPAVACLAVGIALGAWGWGERDASRTQMIEEAEARFDDDVLVEGDPFVPSSPYEAACADLLAAADLRLPAQVAPTPDTGPDGAPLPVAPEVPPEDLAPVLSSVLDPARVAGIAELDITEVQQAMATMRTAVVEASTAGRDLRADPAVVVAGLELRAAVEPLC